MPHGPADYSTKPQRGGIGSQNGGLPGRGSRQSSHTARPMGGYERIMTLLARAVELDIPTIQHPGGGIAIREPQSERARAAGFAVVGHVGHERPGLPVHIGRALDPAHRTAQVGVAGDGGRLYSESRLTVVNIRQVAPPGLLASRDGEIRTRARRRARDPPAACDKLLGRIAGLLPTPDIRIRGWE